MENNLAQLPDTLFITGIGTDVGKSYATGWLARELAKSGKSVITQKFVQTGNKEMSEDIEIHRRIMGIGLQPRDIDHTTAPLILSYPCSPDLAQRIDGINIDWSVAERATATLHEEFDHVLIEGAGGALVPLTGQYLTADYIRDRGLHAAVVTGGTLGSINHTLLTIEALLNRWIKLSAIIYNPYFDTDTTICADTRMYIKNYITEKIPECIYIEMPDKL